MLCVLILIILSNFASCSKILCFFPNPSRSHAIVPLVVADELAGRGHDVTVITMNKLSTNESRYTEIVIPLKAWNTDFLKSLLSGNAKNSIEFMVTATNLYQEVAIETIQSEIFQKLLKEESFDLIWFINVYYNGVQLGIADHFNAPYIMYSPWGHLYYVTEMLGQHIFPSTVPSLYYEVLPKMTFTQRAINMLYIATEWALVKYYDRVQAKQYRENWPQSTRDYYQMKSNASILLLNEHTSESQIVRPTLPTEIEIGGVQIVENPEPLIPEVQNFLDEAKDGAIVWTFGSNLPIFMIDPKKTEIMFKVLGNLKQKVLVKWEKDSSTLPSNFMGIKWLQQASALAHPNVKLFITHGGYGGVMEALYHKVPIFGIPFFADQDYNVMKAEADGWCRGLKLSEITEKAFEEAVLDILNNPSYQTKTNELSKIFTDRITSPMDTAVFWIEYVLRHNGAPHMAYQGKDMNWIQLYSIDVIVFYLILISLPFIFIAYLIKRFSSNKDKHKRD